ncbi:MULTISPECIES: condensation domain-containing protein [unclassified Bosea (in: a-proteobacteria)]|uniref:condensation domain-containing protein n=1 Tax=unclassified Bosea (in: a-proteobacteria) TaxID=2653178 RepID=UPI000F758C61|nr:MULTISPECIES: condensation domain-containing protein [unclassified Bosea (in: a-proteobacteria)]AZO78048.1 condensation protein [Bosea sp. Tri-49]RXT19191.1 condensation protein [Bosea sp. Tri-39]RXT41463.1 condensation protein [Bosea sp. Tri-54]
MSQADSSRVLMPLTLPQLDFWEEFTFHPDEPIATVAHCLDIDGVTDGQALVAAITQTIAEADVLCVRFHVEPGRETPLQSCNPQLRPSLRQFDLRGFADPSQEARARMETDVAAPLDLRGEGLSAFWLLRVGEQRYLWYIRAHHIILDGYGFALIEQRCGQLYSQTLAGSEAGPAFHPFASFIAEEEAYRASRRHESDRAYWQDDFAAHAPLPVLHRGDKDASELPHEAYGVLSEGVSEGLRRLAMQMGIGWPDLLVLLSGLYLSRSLPRQRLDGREVLPFWLPFMSRWGSVAAHMPAMVVNILPFHLSFGSEESLEETLRANAVTLRTQRRHGRYRIEQIAMDNGMPEGSRYFFSPLINVLPFSAPAFHDCKVTREILGSGQGEGIDLTFRGQDDGSELSFAMSGDPTMFAREPFERHGEELPAFLARSLTVEALARSVAELLDEEREEALSAV